MLVIAGPGSGKTMTLIERIKYLVNHYNVQDEKIMVITFSKEAANELKRRYSLQCESDKKVHFGTFHSFFYHILRTQCLYSENSVITDEFKHKMIMEIGKKLNITENASHDWQEKMITKISAYKRGANLHVCAEDGKYEDESFIKIYEMYTDKCSKQHKLDFDDMIIECKKLLENIPKVLMRWQEKYDYYLVDEFQDIDNIQYEILKLLTMNKKNLFCVGDDDQSIYSFRGSAPKIMERFTYDFPDTKIVKMVNNYRCHHDIVKHSEILINNNKKRFRKSFVSCAEYSEGYVCANIVEKSIEEAIYVADKIKELQAINSEMRIAILYRIERCAEVLRNELKRQGLVYISKNKGCNIYKKDWCEDVISYLRIATGNYDKSDLYRILNKPERYLSRELVENEMLFCSKEENAVELNKHLEFMRELSPYAAINYILHGMGYSQFINTKYEKEACENIIGDITLLMSYSKAFININDFINYIEYEKQKKTSLHSESDGDVNCKNALITLQTIHASKGLEYDAVFIVGLQEGIFPGKSSLDEESMEEERRLMYVAMTRAKKFLFLCGRRKDDYGKQESRFITECKITKKL